jgi:hypothetical protein
MGLLTHFRKEAPCHLTRLPSGSFTVDGEGRVVTYTLPQSFPPGYMHEIGRQVLAYFRNAHQARVCVTELIVHYPSLKLSARELRGGAIVFLTPQTLNRT